MDSKVGGIILAGGQSRRMGTDKALLRLKQAGPTLLELVVTALRPLVEPDAMVLVVNQPEKYTGLGLNLRMVPDNYPGKGPLAGLEAGLSVARTEYNLLLACDMPFVQTPLLRALAEWPRDNGQDKWEALVPLNREGLPEPLCALYSTGVLEAARECLQQNKYKMAGFLAEVATRYLPGREIEQYDPAYRSFENLNTTLEMAEASKRVTLNDELK